MSLYNKINNNLLKEQLHQNKNTNRSTFSFYKYISIDQPSIWREELYVAFENIKIWGRIYIAHEGINAQISIPDCHIKALKSYMARSRLLSNIYLNVAVEDNGKSFYKLKILVRKKIVADGINDKTFNPSRAGEPIDALTFNRMAREATIVDIRNHYENEVGHFKGALCPNAETFRDTIPLIEKMLEKKKKQPIIMYCTSGIRCEKASAWLKHRGFKNVFQLKGGITTYAKQVKSKNLENLFVGKNFVFDERLGEKISKDTISQCHQCSNICDHHTNCKNDSCHLLFIQCDSCRKHYNNCCSAACCDVLTLPKEEQKKLRKGINKGVQIFNKTRNKNLITSTLSKQK